MTVILPAGWSCAVCCRDGNSWLRWILHDFKVDKELLDVVISMVDVHNAKLIV